MKLTIDPLNKHEFPVDYIKEMWGIIPIWVGEWNEWDVHEDGVKPLKEYLSEAYGFPMLEMPQDKSTLSEEGVYSYEGDPDLYPLAEMPTSLGPMYQYHYGIVAIPTKDGYFITRMD